MYRIYISSFDGYHFTGIEVSTENEANHLCNKYNEEENNPYCQYVYVRA